MNREQLVSVVGGRALRYVDLSKPSELIPFRGKFPLLESYKLAMYKDAIKNTELISDLSEEFQKITELGNRIALYEQSFIEYIEQRGLDKGDFIKLSNSEKSDKLLDWMNKNCIDYTQLKII